jgi:glycosyltransferase involved in cell wall biosynthesis
VSVAFPLCRSSRFVDNLVANIETLTYPNLEILISDRHGADDALDQLERRYRDDPRVRILRGSDGPDWVTHYNDLLRAARGKYFTWMPHDDSYDPGYIEGLVDQLEARPAALLAYGVTDSEEAGRAVPTQPFAPAPGGWSAPTSVRRALQLHLRWDLFFLVHGLFRRAEVVERGLFLPRTRDTVFADICWAFAVVLAGELAHAPTAVCRKRYLASSASAEWRFGVRQAIDECLAMSRAVWRSGHPNRERIGGVAVLAYLAVARIGWRGLRPIIGRAGRRAPRPIWSGVVRVASWDRRPAIGEEPGLPERQGASAARFAPAEGRHSVTLYRVPSRISTREGAR